MCPCCPVLCPCIPLPQHRGSPEPTEEEEAAGSEGYGMQKCLCAGFQASREVSGVKDLVCSCARSSARDCPW